MTKPKKSKVVVIGGGTGTYQTLLGLKKYPLHLTAIISMSDSGGSSGQLRQELGILPPGDIRRALLALSDLPLSKKPLEKLFEFRFTNGKLQGHSIGNLLLAALTQITGRMDLAVSEASRILEVTGNVLPVTLNHTQLHAKLKNGQIIHGECTIDERDKIKKSLSPIAEVFLKPTGKIFPASAEAIKNADLIILGPGDLYTSIIPNLLIAGVNEQIVKGKTPVVLAINLMTKHGETDGYQASDFVKVIKNYLGPAKNRLIGVLVNRELKTSSQILSWYKKSRAIPVKNDLKQSDGLKVVEAVMTTQATKFVRHDPDKLASAIIEFLH